MKKLILMLLISITTSTFAQETKIPDTTQITLTKFYNDVTQEIKDLATSLKVPAEHVWNILIKQQRVESITYISMLAFVFLTTLILVFLSTLAYKKEWEDMASALLIISVFIVIIEIIAFFFLIPHIITGFTNPEYGAIREITNLITK